MNLVAYWDRFWFDRRDNRPLCLLRVAFGFTFVLHATLYGGLHNLDATRLYFPRHTFPAPGHYFLDGFRMPVPGFGWLPAPSFEAFAQLDKLMLALGVLFTLGLATRLVGATLAPGSLYLFLLSQHLYHHHVMCLVVVLLVLGFSPCGDHYSVDVLVRSGWRRWRGQTRPPDKGRLVLPIRLIQVFVSVLYLFSFLSKLNDGWGTGRVIEVFDASGSLNRARADLLYAYMSPATLARFTVFSEGFLAFGLWLPRRFGLRWLAIAVGVALHLGITCLMAVGTFSFQMIALYVLFAFPPRPVRDEPDDAPIAQDAAAALPVAGAR